MTRHELEDVWADILPPKQPRPDPVPAEILPGYVWMGLITDVRDGVYSEPSALWYERQMVQVPEGEDMAFATTFRPGEAVDVYGLALYSSRVGGDMLWRTDVEHLHITPDSTFTPNLTIRDVGGTAGNFCGWRQMLKMKGILK